MPTARFQMPDGRIARFGVPEGTTPEQAQALMQQHFSAPDAAAKRADFDRRVAEQTAQDRKTYAPTGSYGENVLAATGAGMTSVLRALGGGRAAAALGLPATKEEAAQIDAPLDAAPGGTIGRVIGTAVPAAAALPFTPAALPGALASGFLTGLAMTEGGAGDRAAGGALGAGGGALGSIVGPLYRAGRGVVRGVLEPLTAAGRERVAGRAIERFAANRNALQNVEPTLTGAVPTLAEATRDPGIATLQRAIGTLDPEAAAMLAARQEANNAARVQALERMAGGGPNARTVLERTRAEAAKKSYGKAFAEGVDPDMAAALQPQIASLMARPSIQRAVAQAKQLAAEDGVDLTNAGGSVQGLHYAKQALDDMIERAANEPTKQRLYQQTARDLGAVLEEVAPAYRAAQREFAENSIPINRLDVAQRLLDRTTASVRDMSGNPRLQANAFSRALNDEEALLRNATGFGGRTRLDELMAPEQLRTLNVIRDELETLANLNAAAGGPGSQTAKMLASQNMLRQVMGPLGMPQSMTDSVLAHSLMRPAQWAMQMAEPRIAARVGEALLDPQSAALAVQRAALYDALPPPNALQRLLPRVAPPASGAASAYAQNQ